MKLADYLEANKRRIEATLDRQLPAVEGPAAALAEAMRYSVLAGGKRLRPILVLAASEACGHDPQEILEQATAVELIHTYSLIHDDLPAMDDDDLRRGRPTVHKAFGEALAILAGDALHTLAFELFAGPGPAETAPRRLESLRVLAARAGLCGMVGGQVADLEAEGRACDAERLAWIHRHKTGALFSASAEIGAILAAADGPRREAFAAYGRSLGEAFQIADDILDCTGEAAVLGKTPGKDERSGKTTYPALFGIEASRRRAEAAADEAREALRPLGLLSAALEGLAGFAVGRSA